MAEATPRQVAPRYPLASVDNALRLILLARERRGLRLSEAAQELGVAPSTAHRLLAMLQHRGFVRQDPTTKAYVLGPVLVRLAQDAADGLNLAVRARPVLGEITREVGETSHLCLLEGRETLFLASMESTRPLRTGSRAGLTLPAHCTSGGKAMLAQLPREALREMYPEGALVAMTARSISNFAALEKELATVSRLGYATNVAESEPEIGAVAVAMEPLAGAPRIAFAVSGPTSRVTRKRMPGIAPTLGEAAAELRTQLRPLLES